MFIIVAGALAGLRRPWIGVLMWTWVSLMNPHAIFGWRIQFWPVATVAAVTTLIGLLFTRDRANPFIGAGAWLLLAFMAWVTITLPFSIYVEDSFPLWERTMKTFLMVFVTIALINTRLKLDALIWVMTFSVGFFGIKGGIFTLTTGGNYRVWGPGGFIGGNNEVALALVTIIPMMRYLQIQLQDKRLKLIALGCVGLCAITVLGTYSRGAFLAIVAIVFFLWLKGGKKLQWGIVWAAAAVVGLSFMPEQWWSRMDTIQDYERDESALGRINAWWNAWNLASDRLFGGGFQIYTSEVFARYAPDPTRVHAAHSIYFQALGEQGFIGLGLFLAIGLATWLIARHLINAARIHPNLQWASDLGSMIQVSLIGYAVAGAFLSLTYYDLPYNIVAVSLIAARLVNIELKSRSLAGDGQDSQMNYAIAQRLTNPEIKA